MNFQSISYGFGRVGSNPADDGAMRFFALLIDVSGKGFGFVVVFKYFLEVWRCGGGSLGADFCMRCWRVRGKGPRESLNIKFW